MIKISPYVKFFLNMAKAQTIMNRRFDNGLGGLGFNEFIILYHLNQAPRETLRRIDLAEKIGLTASGVTRLLLPMEKIGLVKSGPSERDARVRNVTIASGGKRRLHEALERAEDLTHEIISSDQKEKIKELSEILSEMIGRARMG